MKIRTKPKLTIKPKISSKPSDKAKSSKPLQTSAKGSSKTAKGFAVARANIQRSKDEYEKRINTPFRMRLAIGEEVKVVILDKDPFFFYEHHWESKPGKWDKLEVCIKERSNCPLCETLDKESYYVMMLTCIDPRPFKKQDGKEVKRSKKLLPIKMGMMPKYERIWKKHGSLRGVVLNIVRDGKKSPATGDSIEFVKILSEEELKKYGDLATPVDYNKSFPVLPEEEMRKKYKVGPTPGSEDISSDEDLDDEWDSVDSNDDDGDEPF